MSIKILLKLAKIEGYDENGRIRNRNGEFIDGSSLLHLIINAMSVGHVLVGESEFIDLMKEAKITPDEIPNNNVKAKLLASLYTTQPAPTPQMTPRTYSRIQETPMDFRQETKRKRVDSPEAPVLEEEDTQPSAKRRRHEVTTLPTISWVGENDPYKQLQTEEDNSLSRVGWEVPRKRGYEEDDDSD